MRKRKRCPKCGGVISLCHVSGPKGEDLGWQYSHAYSFEELLSEKVKLCDYMEEVQGHAPGPGGSSRRDIAEGPEGPGADGEKSGGVKMEKHKHEWVASADPSTGRRNGPWTCECGKVVTDVEKAEELDREKN